MTEKKQDEPAKKQDYEAMVRARVDTRAVSLKQRLYESVSKEEPSTDKKIISQKVCLEETVCKKEEARKKE